MQTRKSPLRMLSVLLTVAVLFGVFACLPVGAAEELTDGDFKYTVQNGEATITGYTGNGGTVTIPSTLGGYPVTSIGGMSFYDNDSLTGVVIPEGVTAIGEYAFSQCDGLASVIIPDSVTSIGESAFGYCPALTSVFIPDSVTTMGWFVFDRYNKLTVYCEAEEQPEGWAYGWDDCFDGFDGWVLPFEGIMTVVWGYRAPTSLGDLSGDGTLNANDYMMLKRYVLHTFSLTDEQIAVADVNGDGTVNANDYMMLKRAVLGTFMLPTA